jgi:hypothetical protein
MTHGWLVVRFSNFEPTMMVVVVVCSFVRSFVWQRTNLLDHPLGKRRMQAASAIIIVQKLARLRYGPIARHDRLVRSHSSLLRQTAAVGQLIHWVCTTTFISCAVPLSGRRKIRWISPPGRFPFHDSRGRRLLFGDRTMRVALVTFLRAPAVPAPQVAVVDTTTTGEEGRETT